MLRVRRSIAWSHLIAIGFMVSAHAVETLRSDWLTISGDVPPLWYQNPFPGKADGKGGYMNLDGGGLTDNKDIGPQYVRGVEAFDSPPSSDSIWLTYSLNKENIWVAEVPTPIRGTVDEASESQAPGGAQDSPPQQHYTPAADLRGQWEFVPDPKLPNVLILGDSISIAYTLDARQALRGKANVFRPMLPDKKPQNCGDTPRGLALLDEWLGDTRWDLIHFNWGLWDLCYRHPQSKEQGGRDKVRGKLTTTPKDYERNLEKLAARLKATGAKLIWANITVVPEGEAGRFVGDDIKYNAIAARVMERHHIPVNDLHRTSKSFPPELFSGPGDVHFTAEGSAKLARQVAKCISNALEARKQPIRRTP